MNHLIHARRHRYPFEPPEIIFRDAIYHPNVDDKGHICLDFLKMPPKGAWRPTISLVALLNAVRVLLCEPNPDDPLMPEIVLLVAVSISMP